jgi:ABC-type glycerol-3-phosphate transport system substrate-binding protein
MKRHLAIFITVLFTGASGIAQQKAVTIATVNNPAMIELKKLSPKFEAANPDIKLNWVVVEENILRQRVTTDVSTGSGQFDLVFIGLYETPIFAKRGWLREMANLPPDYDLDDVFKSIRDGLSYEGKLYALPFYGESSMLMYRKDLLEAKGLTMPEQPTYGDIKKFADALTDIPKKAKQSEAAQRFAEWATSKDYIKLVAEDAGWATVPPGTRKSTYDNPDYQTAAPFAPVTLRAMQTADPTNPCIKPVPYTGVQFVGIPEFQSLGTVVGQNISGVLAGKMSVDQALKDSQAAAERTMKEAGYVK